MKSLPRLRALVSGLTGVSVRAAGLASSVAQAQQGYSVRQRSRRDSSNFVAPLRTGPNFVRPQRSGAGPNSNDFQFQQPAMRRCFDFEQQKRLWSLQERGRYQRERSPLLPDPDYATPGTRPYSIFHRDHRSMTHGAIPGQAAGAGRGRPHTGGCVAPLFFAVSARLSGVAVVGTRRAISALCRCVESGPDVALGSAGWGIERWSLVA